MPLFTSKREKQFWFWACVVFATIFSTLFLGQPLARQLSNQDLQAILFSIGLIGVGAVIIVHVVRTQPGKIEISILLGIIAIYIMFFLRLGVPERSHLIEYSVLAVFIHKALLERAKKVKLKHSPSLIAFVVALSVGLLDESIQIILPNRVYDLQDILFNCVAVILAIGSRLVLIFVRKRIGKTKPKE